MNLNYNPENAVMDLPRRDSEDKLLGRTKYTIDSIPSDSLHAVLLRAEVASGDLISVDTKKASRMKGVKAIATYDDAPGYHGLGIADTPVFAHENIKYHGEPIAAVAATTVEKARKAFFE